MKLTIDKKVFAQALAEVAPFAPTKAPVQILRNAKLTTKGKWLKIEANDAQSSMVRYVELIECDTDGAFLVGIAELNKFVAKTKGDTIEITVDGNTVHLKHSKGSIEFQTENVDEFPAFKFSQAEVVELQLPSDIFAEAIRRGRNFISDKAMLRPQMSAIYAYVKDGEFGYCATDTHKLIHGHYAAELPEDLDTHWLIMPPVFTAIINACKGADIVKIQITETHVSYRLGGTLIQSTQAKGQYPNFKRVIPQSWSMECAVDKSELLDALGRVSMFCDGVGCTKWSISPLDMTISVDNLNDMKSSREQLGHNGCNGDITIGLSAYHSAICAGVFDNGEIVLRMSDASRPVLFGQQGIENLCCLLMPMQVNN